MIDPEVAAEIANCPPGSRYELFLKHMDVFELPPERLEVNDVEDRQIGDAAELQNFELYTPEAQIDFAHGGNIGIPAPNAGLVVPKVEPYDFAAYAPRERVSVQIDHLRSLGYERNQAPSPNSVFISNGSNSGESDILWSSNNVTEVGTDMRQSQSSSARKSKRIATKERRPIYDDSEWSLPQSKAVRHKKLLQKKKKRMSRLSHLTEVSPGCSHRRAEENKCTCCGIAESTEWSEGPGGPNTLCRLCGIRYRCSGIQDRHLPVTPTSDPEFSQEAVNVTNNVVQGTDMAPDMAHVAVPEIGPEMSESSVDFEDQPWENLRPRNQKKKYREMAAAGQPAAMGKCTHCGTENTAQWREGPMGKRTLCNACGLRFKLGRLYPEYRPAKSPTFVPSVNSNSHRQVVALRKRKVANELSSSENESTQPQSDAVKEASTEFPASLPNANEEITVMEEASSSEKESTHPQSEAATKFPTGSILPLKDMEEAAVVEAHPSLSLSETTKEIRAQMPQSDGFVCEFFELACYVNLLQENVKTMKDKLSNLLDESGLNKNQLHEAIVKEEVDKEPSMPLGPPFEATTECVVGLVAKRVISPPLDVEKIAPVSERAGPVIKISGEGHRVKRVPKKEEKNLKKKLRKVSGESGAQKTMAQETSLPKRCLHCDSSQTPQWRDGPLGPKTLCNACGIRYRAGGLLPEYRPLLSPGFVPTLHSSLQKQVIRMRKKETHEEASGASSVNQEAANVEMGPQTPPPPECTPTNSYSVNSESGDLCCFP